MWRAREARGPEPSSEGGGLPALGVNGGSRWGKPRESREHFSGPPISNGPVLKLLDPREWAGGIRHLEIQWQKVP